MLLLAEEEAMPGSRAARRGGPALPFAAHLVWCLVLAASWATASRPTYLLTTPWTIRPGANISIAVALLKESPPEVTVKAEVVNSNTTVLNGEAVFQRDSFGTLTLPALPFGSASGDYRLQVKGFAEGLLLFSKDTALSFEHKSFTVFIQTDKTIYKPGQDVKIRIVTLYPDLKPYNTPVNVHIWDPRHNLLQQWLAQNGNLGKISKQFKLSKYPVLGDWSIQVQANDQTHYQTFTVMEYVLPKFEVFLTTPLYYSSKDKHFNGTVTAKYTYGKPVKGKATISYFSVFYGTRTNNITKVLEINGSVNFTLHDLEIQYLNSANQHWHDAVYQVPLEIIAVVTESLTGISQNSSATVFPKHHDYILEFSEYPRVLKPSLSFMATNGSIFNHWAMETVQHMLVQVVHAKSDFGIPTQEMIKYLLFEAFKKTHTRIDHIFDLIYECVLSWLQLKITRADYRPLTTAERENNVLVSVKHRKRTFFHMYDYSRTIQNNEAAQNLSYFVPENGIIQIEFPVQKNTTALEVKAHFLSGQTSMIIYDVFYSPSQTYLLIKKPSQNLKVGTPLELSVRSNRPTKEISYMVVSKEQIVAVGKTKAPTLSLTPENSWAPKACIIAYYVSNSGEVVNDAVSVPVQPVFKNQVNITWSKDKAGPSEKISLKINVTEPKTSVALLIVDKSTKLLGKRSDITEDVINHELSLYNAVHSSGEARDSFSVFQKCNLWVASDADLLEYEDSYYDMEVAIADDMDYMYSARDAHYPKPIGMPADFNHLHIRTNFPETWIWREVTLRSNETTLDVTVPDTITSWVASAFILSENLGLGVTKAPVELEVFQSFFVSLNLPSSVIRGEELLLEVNIFNYLKENLKVTVTLDTSDAFEILILSNDINTMGNQQSVWVPSEDGMTVIFPIKPKQIGEIPLRVTAVSPISSDAVLQKVLVKAEGIEQSHSQALLLELSKRVGQSFLPNSTAETLNFTFPSDVVPGSERVQITVVGDILGPSINGLDSLIKMPYGCGEQNMINFAPNIYVLDYLTSTGELKPSTKSKAVSYMREGYQRELLYQRDDGSFSAFGNSDSSGSTWLSAFVLKSFVQAQRFIEIDPYILERTAAWIANHQGSSGEFQEPGRVLHSELQGGAKSSVSLTAYILTALLEYQTDKYEMNIRKALNFLEVELIQGISDNYTLALVTYALSLAKSQHAKTALDALNEKSEQQGGLRYWTSLASGLPDSWQPSSVDIELASYALMSHAKQQRLLEGASIMKWLSQQRNHLGGYASTQDTIVALQALSTCAMLTSGIETEMDITVTASTEEDPFVFGIDHNNRLLLQTKEIAATQPVWVTVSARGKGFGMFQLNILYNVKSSQTGRRRRSAQNPEAFDLDVAVKDDKKDINHLTLNVCTRYLGTGSSSRSGMALLEIGLLSGFSLSPSFVALGNPVKKVEEDEGKVYLYLDSLNGTQFCVDIPATRNFKVANAQDASVIVLDYYEPGRRTVRSYNSRVMQNLTSCAFCGESSCDLCETQNSSSTIVCLSWGLLIVYISLVYRWLV